MGSGIGKRGEVRGEEGGIERFGERETETGRERGEDERERGGREIEEPSSA